MADDPLHNGSVPANELRQVQSLLWTVIVERLNPAEVDEVRVPSSRRRRRLSTHPLVPSTRDRPFPPPPLAGAPRVEFEHHRRERAAHVRGGCAGGDHRRRPPSHRHQGARASPLRESQPGARRGRARLLVRSIRRCASGDFGTPRDRRARTNATSPGPTSARRRRRSPAPPPSSNPRPNRRAAAKARADRLSRPPATNVVSSSTSRVPPRRLIRAGTPRTPPSRPASSRPTTAGSSSSAGSFGAIPRRRGRYERNIAAFDVDGWRRR